MLGLLAIVAGVESYLAGRREDLGTIYTIEWRWTGQAIAREARGSRVLCFGSSLTRMGVSTRVLEERLGVPAYNFAASGAQPYACYAMLRLALDAGAEPEAVVVDFAPWLLATRYDANERVLPEVASLARCAELAVAARDRSFLARIALIRLMPSFRCRNEIRANILAAVDGREPRRYPERHLMARNTNANRGASQVTPAAPVARVDLTHPEIFPGSWSCDPVSERYIHEFLALAESRGIPVFWLVPPIAPAAQHRREELGLEARFTRFIRGFVARHPGVVVVDGRESRYSNGAFFDMVHLSRDGAVALTDDLAEVIRSLPRGGEAGGRRWVALPDYRPDPLASRIEDSIRSLRMVEDALGKGLLR